ncbi:hypothetical protein GRF29_77g26546 [Pseudopithomyces chartarum]|uniref:Scytalone dehydratase-like protein Arp1 N-terminal domain-containing protein n=1 Tax=Pseudopithomyces chartarum TaxID=1892770 RepID=A0AAN6LXW6_9PLEO|nr:hypothetical protein GRF29_77g26546 [Pseudopithomyces chartarum]
MTDPNLSLPHSGLQSGFQTNENRLFQIDNAHYIAMPLPNTPKLDFPNDKIAPVTVIADSLPSDLDQSWVQQLVDGWSQTDDVFRHEFLQNIIFLTSKEQKSGIDNIRDELRTSPGTEWSIVVQPKVDEHNTTSGPFVMWNGSLITHEEPAESADYFAAVNPRGDGYQSAWSSSGGSGASLASYDWLDFTLSTDTTGSSRRPALANGLFQLRISKEKPPFEGVVPSWLTEVSIKDLMKKKTPKEADSSDIEEFLEDVGVTSFCYGVYEELQDFRNTYREKYSKEPYVNPTMRWRWDAARNVTKERYDDAV